MKFSVAALAVALVACGGREASGSSPGAEGQMQMQDAEAPPPDDAAAGTGDVVPDGPAAPSDDDGAFTCPAIAPYRCGRYCLPIVAPHC